MHSIPEAWLRGPLPGIQAHLQPAAHALLQVREDIEPVVAPLDEAHLWVRPGGVASIGFHLLHLAGSTDRLMTYSRGEPLSALQVDALAAEKAVYEARPAKAVLVGGLSRVIDDALAYLRSVPAGQVLHPREVGRKRLPSNTLGLIFHAAEHASRHAGQVVTLGPIVRSEAGRL